jgi:hypothetical protein
MRWKKRGEGRTYVCESCTERVPFAFEGGYRLCSYGRAGLQIRTPKVLLVATATRFAALSAFPCFGYHLMQRVQVFLHVVFLEQFIRVVLVEPNDTHTPGVRKRRKGLTKKKGTYDDVRFDKVRYGVKHAFCAAGLLLAPERETL